MILYIENDTIYCEYDIKLFLENKLKPTGKQILIC